MAKQSLTIEITGEGAEPAPGNYTHPAEMHLWCAAAISRIASSPDLRLKDFGEETQQAIRYLAACEVSRAQNAFAADDL